MLGETGIWTYVAYGAIAAFLLMIVALFLRTAFILSILFVSPLATFLRRVPVLGALVGRIESSIRRRPVR